MSSYLVALVAGPFTRESLAISSRGVKLSAYVPLGASGSPAFALTVASASSILTYLLLFNIDQTLNYFQSYFQQLFVMSKIDLIALPDFSFGAMENWCATPLLSRFSYVYRGAITFREQLMLVEEGKTSELQKKLVAYVVAHELAHQWFVSRFIFSLVIFMRAKYFYCVHLFDLQRSKNLLNLFAISLGSSIMHMCVRPG